MDLERDLRAIELEWPETPELRLSLPAQSRSRRPWLVAIATAVVVAVAAALAVPQSRGAILRLFHLGGVTIVRVDTLPPAQERPLAAGLGPVVSRSEAEGLLRTAPLLPPGPAPPLHVANGVVSLVLADRGRPVLLSELGSGDPLLMKKLLATGTSIEGTRVGPAYGYWISGAPHAVYLGPDVSPRLAGNVLLWQRDGLTLRLEGNGLTRGRAVALARSLR